MRQGLEGQRCTTHMPANWCRSEDLNPAHLAYKASALPDELDRQCGPSTRSDASSAPKRAALQVGFDIFPRYSARVSPRCHQVARSSSGSGPENLLIAETLIPSIQRRAARRCPLPRSGGSSGALGAQPGEHSNNVPVDDPPKSGIEKPRANRAVTAQLARHAV